VDTWRCIQVLITVWEVENTPPSIHQKLTGISLGLSSTMVVHLDRTRNQKVRVWVPIGYANFCPKIEKFVKKFIKNSKIRQKLKNSSKKPFGLLLYIFTKSDVCWNLTLQRRHGRGVSRPNPCPGVNNSLKNGNHHSFCAGRKNKYYSQLYSLSLKSIQISIHFLIPLRVSRI
jgi:hypothetical protein